MAISVPSDFLTFIRSDLGDSVTPYLWSDVELYDYMNEAQNEFARETKCIPDSNTFTEIPFPLNDGWIALDPVIIDIRRAVSASGTVFTVMSEDEFSSSYVVDDYGYQRKGRWEDSTGTPTHLITDMQTDELRFFPIPTVADTLDLYVRREPTDVLDSTSVGFEIPNKYIIRLMYKMKELAYGRQDFETFDGDKRNVNKALWEDAISDAQSKVMKRTHKNRGIRYGGL